MYKVEGLQTSLAALQLSQCLFCLSNYLKQLSSINLFPMLLVETIEAESVFYPHFNLSTYKCHKLNGDTMVNYDSRPSIAHYIGTIREKHSARIVIYFYKNAFRTKTIKRKS